MIAARLSESVRPRGKSFGQVAPTLAPGDRMLIILSMSEQKHIAMSTTDTIPGPAGNREVRRSALTWISGYLSIEDASGAMARWAETNGYDAIIGIRFEAHPDDDYSGGPDFGAESGTRLRWTIYGTAIGW